MNTPTKTVCYLIDRDTGKPERLPLSKTIFIMDSDSDYNIGIEGWVSINKKARELNPLLDKVRIMVREEVIKSWSGNADPSYLISWGSNPVHEYPEDRHEQRVSIERMDNGEHW